LRNNHVGSYINSGGKTHLDNGLTKEEMISCLESLDRIREETNMFVKLNIPVPYCSVWDEKPHLRYLVETSTCTAGRTIMQIDPSGNVKPCPMVDVNYGNILEEDLTDIWERVGGWSDDTYIPESCEPCDLTDRCKGACRADSERILGSLNEKHPYSVSPVKVTEDKPDYNLKAGNRLIVPRTVRARKECDNVYVLFATDRYMVTNEPTARFLSAIGLDGITLDEGLVNNEHAIEAIGKAYHSGILKKAA
jgi:radical SAM protein with 4Fe4S-binding SPASM domain